MKKNIIQLCEVNVSAPFSIKETEVDLKAKGVKHKIFGGTAVRRKNGGLAENWRIDGPPFFHQLLY